MYTQTTISPPLDIIFPPALFSTMWLINECRLSLILTFLVPILGWADLTAQINNKKKIPASRAFEHMTTNQQRIVLAPCTTTVPLPTNKAGIHWEFLAEYIVTKYIYI